MKKHRYIVRIDHTGGSVYRVSVYELDGNDYRRSTKGVTVFEKSEGSALIEARRMSASLNFAPIESQTHGNQSRKLQ